ncbi:hypothetical protein CHARACLAT_019531 [Characodon lateralis]|uniref:Uncharacterized protein n=1 Tax=Characodon lateralis TaxID=208331 RepID=A0ABU7DAZ8_9TELE|nr:hypothetical protein [Characodon lateralis]
MREGALVVLLMRDAATAQRPISLRLLYLLHITADIKQEILLYKFLHFQLRLCGYFVFIFSFFFSGGNVFPRLSSPKGFPSASDYLWLELVSCQPSGPLLAFESPVGLEKEGGPGQE